MRSGVFAVSPMGSQPSPVPPLAALDEGDAVHFLGPPGISVGAFRGEGECTISISRSAGVDLDTFVAFACELLIDAERHPDAAGSIARQTLEAALAHDGVLSQTTLDALLGPLLDVQHGLLGACAGFARFAVFAVAAARSGRPIGDPVEGARAWAESVLREQGLAAADAVAKVKAALPKG